MDPARFEEIVTSTRDMLVAAFSGLAPGKRVFYNAYWKGTEVVVMGYQYEQGGHTLTKPLCIAVDPEVFANLRVDHETGRYEDGGLADPKVV